MKLAIKDIVKLSNSIDRLSSLEETGKLSKPLSSKCRHTFYIALRTFRVVAKDAEEFRQSLLKELFPDGAPTETSPAFLVFLKRYGEFMDTVEEVNISEKVSVNELLDSGAPISLISDLELLFTEEAKP